MHKHCFIFFSVLFLCSCGSGSPDLTGNADSCSGYTDSASSLYVLPYLAGEDYMVTQGNCSEFTHKGLSSFAYDFGMPLGTTVAAIRSGTVLMIKENAVDGNQG